MKRVHLLTHEERGSENISTVNALFLFFTDSDSTVKLCIRFPKLADVKTYSSLFESLGRSAFDAIAVVVEAVNQVAVTS